MGSRYTTDEGDGFDLSPSLVDAVSQYAQANTAGQGAATVQDVATQHKASLSDAIVAELQSMIERRKALSAKYDRAVAAESSPNPIKRAFGHMKAQGTADRISELEQQILGSPALSQTLEDQRQERNYGDLVAQGVSPKDARSLLVSRQFSPETQVDIKRREKMAESDVAVGQKGQEVDIENRGKESDRRTRVAAIIELHKNHGISTEEANAQIAAIYSGHAPKTGADKLTPDQKAQLAGAEAEQAAIGKARGEAAVVASGLPAVGSTGPMEFAIRSAKGWGDKEWSQAVDSANQDLVRVAQANGATITQDFGAKLQVQDPYTLKGYQAFKVLTRAGMASPKAYVRTLASQVATGRMTGDDVLEALQSAGVGNYIARTTPDGKPQTDRWGNPMLDLDTEWANHVRSQIDAAQQKRVTADGIAALLMDWLNKSNEKGAFDINITGRMNDAILALQKRVPKVGGNDTSTPQGTD